MLRLLTLLVLFTASWPGNGQDSSRSVRYHLGLKFAYAGDNSPAYSLPIGFGIAASATLNKSRVVKPTIDLSAAYFPGFSINLFGYADDSPAPGYAVYSLLAGTKLQLSKAAGIALATGTSFNTSEHAFFLGVKPSLEITAKGGLVLFNLHYLDIVNSEALEGYGGLAILFRLR